MARDHEHYVDALCQLVAQRVDALRKERGLTVNWLADFAGIARGHMSRLLRGQTNPSVRTLALLANALDVPFAAIFEVEEPKRPGPVARRSIGTTRRKS